MFDGFPRQQSSLSERIECKHNYTYNSFNIAYNLIHCQQITLRCTNWKIFAISRISHILLLIFDSLHHLCRSILFIHRCTLCYFLIQLYESYTHAWNYIYVYFRGRFSWKRHCVYCILEKNCYN